MKRIAIAAIMLACCQLIGAQQTSSSKPSPAMTAENNTPVSSGDDLAQPTQSATAAPNPIASLPSGTEIRIRLETALSTSMSKTGDIFAGRVIEDVLNQGKVVIPVGASVKGKVVRTVEQRRIHGKPYIELRPDRVVMPNGSLYAIDAVVTDTDKASNTSVDQEGRIEGSGMNGRDKIEILGGTAAGVGIGAWTGGVKGSFIGAAIGGGSALVYWLTKHKSAELAPGTEMWIELSRPVALTASSD